MRKALLALVVVLAIGFGAAAVFQPTEAGFGSCTYKCVCSVQYRCCTVNGVQSCKPAPDGPLGCPQIAC
jgi:hypothetical protein